MAEFLVRFVFEIVLLGLLDLLARLGRLVARPVVSLLTGGRVLLDPPPGNLVVVRRWHGLHRLTDGTPVLGETLTALLGLALLAAAAVVVLAAVR
jgi:hypothetical protein